MEDRPANPAPQQAPAPGFETDRPVRTLSAALPDRDLFGNTPRGRANWDHRRGEPRWFALIWTLFLMGSAALSVGSAAGTGLNDQDAYQAGVRVLVLCLAGGAALFWPLVRLSQTAPRRPALAMVVDALVVAVPTQLLVWPQVFPFLAAWTLEATVVVAVLLLMWAAVIAGLLVLALSNDAKQTPARRGFWMSGFVLLALGGPGAAWFQGQLSGDPGIAPSDHPPAGYLVSPITAPWEPVRPRQWSGRPVHAGSGHWVAVGLASAAAAGVWIAAGARRVADRTPAA